MKRTPIAAALLILAACGPKGAPPSAFTLAEAKSFYTLEFSQKQALPTPVAAAQPAATAAPAAPPPAEGPDPAAAVVRALYAAERTPFPANSGKSPFFTVNLAAALKAHSHPGEAGALNMDYRYGAQYVQVTHLAIGPAAATPTGARVAVRFDNIGMPREVDYNLVRTRQGWRIAEVSAPARKGVGGWSLRALLKLPRPI